MTAGTFLDVLADVIATTVEPAALAVDRDGAFPLAAVTALGARGLLGLLSATEVGGLGLGLAEATQVVRRLAANCGSTAMVVAMHYSATAAIESHAPMEVRRAVAAGHHLSTLAFSETGSRSHFWVPLGTATVADGVALLNANKSWVTSAGAADSYVWSSRPASAPGGATLWLVSAKSPGLTVAGGFDGLGLRGNASHPVTARDVPVPLANRLGADGSGMDIARTTILPVFQLLNASCSLGFMDAAIARSIDHLGSARFAHLDRTLAEQPVLRQHLARMKNCADAASTLVQDALSAIATGRADASLRMLQSKVVAAEAALEVLDLAMRVGGGAAFRKDIGIERYFRDARAAAVMAPTSDVLQELIGRMLVGLPLFERRNQA